MSRTVRVRLALLSLIKFVALVTNFITMSPSVRVLIKSLPKYTNTDGLT